MEYTTIHRRRQQLKAYETTPRPPVFILCGPTAVSMVAVRLCEVSPMAGGVAGPRTRTAIRQRRAFSVAGHPAWNGLPVALRLTPVAHLALFLSSLKTTLFDRGWAGSAPE